MFFYVSLSNSQYGFKDDVTNANDLDDDTQDDYNYDMYGNMTQDQNKHIVAIKYNHLNLPMRINFDTGSYITYLYDASGVKAKKTVYTQHATLPTTSITEYKGTFQYTSKANGSASEIELQFIFTPEGYYNVVNVSPSGDMVGAYVYNYTDHLGNIRLSYTWDDNLQELATLEEHHYYPFGLEHKFYNNTRKMYDKQTEEITQPNGSKITIVKPVVVQVPNSGYQYQYQGQERQDELNLNWDSFKWRNYDYAIGRFMSVDPLSEKYVYNGVYNFSENRVIDARELEGLEANLLNPTRTAQTVMTISLKIINWVTGSVSYNKSDGYSSGKSEKVPGSGVEIKKTLSSGDSGRSVAGHPEDNVSIDYNDLENVLGSWKDLPGKVPIKGMTDAVKKVESPVSNFKTAVEKLDEGMDAGESVVNFVESVKSNKDESSNKNSSHGFQLYYYDKTSGNYEGRDNLSKEEYNNIIQRKDIEINPMHTNQ